MLRWWLTIIIASKIKFRPLRRGRSGADRDEGESHKNQQIYTHRDACVCAPQLRKILARCDSECTVNEVIQQQTLDKNK